MQEQVKELRVQIDGLAQLTKALKPMWDVCLDIDKHFLQDGGSVLPTKRINFNSKEVEKAYDSLLLAKAWLGKVLAELGSENPYKSGYKKVSDIEPTADVFPLKQKEKARHWELISFLEKKNHIQKVDWLRTEIEKIIVNYSKLNEQHPNFLLSKDGLVYMHLSEAKFWLGFELARIRELNIDPIDENKKE